MIVTGFCFDCNRAQIIVYCRNWRRMFPKSSQLRMLFVTSRFPAEYRTCQQTFTPHSDQC